MSAFTHEALASYLPTVDALMNRLLGEWATGEEIRWLDGFKRLVIEVDLPDRAGAAARTHRRHACARNYETPARRLHEPAHPTARHEVHAGQAGARRVLAIYERNVREHQARPQGTDQPPSDGLDAHPRRALGARRQRHRPRRAQDGAAPRRRGRRDHVGLVRRRRSRARPATPRCAERLRGEVAALPPGPPTLADARSRDVPPASHDGAAAPQPRRPGLLRKGAAESSSSRTTASPRAGWCCGGIRSSHLRSADLPRPRDVRPRALLGGAPRTPAPPARLRPERRAAARPRATSAPATSWRRSSCRFSSSSCCAAATAGRSRPARTCRLDWSKVPPAPRDGLKARLTRSA
jgi:hypothetical protein